MRSLGVRRKRGCKTDGGEASEVEIEPGECSVLEAPGRTGSQPDGIVSWVKSS